MRRLTAYVAGSAALATGVVSWAFLERPNFYSAAVYLSQSNACLMILSNFALICVGAFMYGLEQLLFGPIRPAEIEQLYERGWFAITEWLFAMSTFRDEFGVWFLTMFTTLFIGKVWGWLAEGRIETLEQQPPANPRLFHTRLVASLALYAFFAMQMFWYCADMVVYEARPGVMVMFVFEFAIIFISAISTILRYTLWWEEHRIIKKQTKQKLEEHKAQIRAAREQAQQEQQTQAEGVTSADTAADPTTISTIDAAEDEIDEDDIEVPGWESKGGWLFALDIGTDLLKLVAYMAFFTILTVFYGIPIYIIRDMYLTLRSFSKRVSDYIKYQKATRDMNQRYPDATAEELAADNTCIVCREEMRPWPQPGVAVPAAQSIPERNRPKKLPCGHILHFGCLRSWLERQQVCPTCRRSVLAPNPSADGNGNQNLNNQDNGRNIANAFFGNGPRAGHGANNPQANRAQRGGLRRIQLGPFRLEFGRPDNDAMRQLLHQMGRPNRQVRAARQPGTGDAGTLLDTQVNRDGPGVLQLQQGLNTAIANAQLAQFEQHLQREFQALNNTRYRVDLTRALFRELERARTNPEQTPPVVSQWPPAMQSVPFPINIPGANTAGGGLLRPLLQDTNVHSQSGAPLPEGLVLPPGYKAVPLTNVNVPPITLRSSLLPVPTLHPEVMVPLAPAAGGTITDQLRGQRPDVGSAIATSIANITARTEQAIPETVPNENSANGGSTLTTPSVAPVAFFSPVTTQRNPSVMALNGASTAPDPPSVEVEPPTPASVASSGQHTTGGNHAAVTSSAPSIAPFTAEQSWNFPSPPLQNTSSARKKSKDAVRADSQTDIESSEQKAHQPTVEDAGNE